MHRTLALVLAGAVLAGLGLVAAPVGPVEAASEYVSAKSLLAHLPVRAKDHAHRYNRSRFSYDNSYDADGDGCYTRKEVLKREAVRLDKVSASCALYGQWRSLYDGKVYTDNWLEIDHLVPLAEAWHSGAYGWSHRRQIAFGNEIDYKWALQPVFYTDNQNKQDFEPGEWMPTRNRCTYAKAWIAVKARWGLTVDPAEKAVLGRKLAHCSSMKVLRPGKPNVGRLVGNGDVEPIEKV